MYGGITFHKLQQMVSELDNNAVQNLVCISFPSVKRRDFLWPWHGMSLSSKPDSLIQVIGEVLMIKYLGDSYSFFCFVHEPTELLVAGISFIDKLLNALFQMERQNIPTACRPVAFFQSIHCCQVCWMY